MCHVLSVMCWGSRANEFGAHIEFAGVPTPATHALGRPGSPKSLTNSRRTVKRLSELWQLGYGTARDKPRSVAIEEG